MNKTHRRTALFFVGVVGIGVVLDTFVLATIERETAKAGILFCYLFGVFVGFSLLRGDDDSPAVGRSALYAAILITIYLFIW